MIFTVLDIRTKQCVGSYQADHITIKTPYTDVINYIHKDVEYGKYPEGYYIGDTGSVLYNTDYLPAVNSYQVLKYAELESKQSEVEECTMRFAAENSELLNNEIGRLAGLGQLDPTDPVQLATFVRNNLDPLVDAMLPVTNDLNMHYYWRIGSIIDAIERDTLLRTDERLNEWRDKILAVVM